MVKTTAAKRQGTPGTTGFRKQSSVAAGYLFGIVHKVQSSRSDRTRGLRMAFDLDLGLRYEVGEGARRLLIAVNSNEFALFAGTQLRIDCFPPWFFSWFDPPSMLYFLQRTLSQQH